MPKNKKMTLFGLCQESKSSDGFENPVNRKSMKKTEVYEKLVREGKAHPDCVNASNPYHSCASYCYERMGKAPEMHVRAQGLALAQKNKEPQGRETNNEGSKERIKEVEKPNDEAISDNVDIRQSIKEEGEMSKTYFVHDDAEEMKLSYEQNTSQRDDGRRLEETKSCKQDEELSEILTGPYIGSMNSNISEISVVYEDDEDDEDPSINSRVSVGQYYVKPSNSTILQAVLSKHGDVAANCHLESALMRSCYLDSLCLVIRELQSVLFLQLTKTKVRELSAVVKDAESVGLNVAWLRKKLDEIGEAMELIVRHSAIKAAKAKCQQNLEVARKELAFLDKDVVEKERTVESSRSRVLETTKHLLDLEEELLRLNESYLDIRRKVEGINIKSVSDELMT